jgi:hypothetical protein
MDFTHRNSGVSLSRGMSDEEKLNCLGNYWCSLVRCCTIWSCIADLYLCKKVYQIILCIILWIGYWTCELYSDKVLYCPR